MHRYGMEPLYKKGKSTLRPLWKGDAVRHFIYWYSLGEVEVRALKEGEQSRVGRWVVMSRFTFQRYGMKDDGVGVCVGAGAWYGGWMDGVCRRGGGMPRLIVSLC